MAEGAENPRAVIGDNKPPLREALADASKALLGEVADVISAAGGIVAVTSDEEDGAAASIAVDLGKLRAMVKAKHDEEKRPFLDSGNTVDDFFRPWFGQIDAAVARLRAKVADYKTRKALAERARQEEIARASRAEAARIAAVAAQRRAEGEDPVAEDMVAKGMAQRAEHASAAATAPISGATRVVDKSSGASSTAHLEWTFEVEDRGKIQLEALRDYLTDKAINAAIAAFVADEGRALPGVRIYQAPTVHFKARR